ncbi:MAG: hypothetical protein DBX61_08570 [Clostridiales bacterium]|nr:MAG: hypothetical protein DBX61_08570 [Clostridiales bacterium]
MPKQLNKLRFLQKPKKENSPYCCRTNGLFLIFSISIAKWLKQIHKKPEPKTDNRLRHIL